jgi:outer membrane receptor protein involved in Fe transport
LRKSGLLLAGGLVFSGASAGCLVPAAIAQEARPSLDFDIPAQPLDKALRDYGRVTRQQIVFDAGSVKGVTSPAIRGRMSREAALSRLLQGTRFASRTGANGIIIVAPHSAQADAAPDPAVNAVEVADDIVVTGTRIRSKAGGPNPVTRVTARELSQLSPQSLPAALAKLPVFSPIKSSDSASDGGYQPTGNYLDLWGLGPIRTLILQDGHRVPATYYDGNVDINTLPQLLVQRVEIVTGGASAVYGSDAVSGVANFILDKDLEGVKGLVQGGLSTHGDGESFRAGVAHGFKVGDRGHFEWSAEYFHRAGISAADRAYGDSAVSIVGSGTAANPLSQVSDSRLNNSTFGGLVTTGPFAGQRFLPDGTLTAFDKGAVTGTSGISVGGDGSYRRNNNLLPSLTTAQLFGRFDYDLGGSTKAWVQASYAQTWTLSHEQNLISTNSSTPITIYSGNAYLLPQYQALLDQTGTSSFNLNRYNEDFGNILGLRNRTSAFSAQAGLQGKLFADLDWEVYYTYGVGKTSQLTTNNVNTERLYAALDAVVDPASGNVVCRSSLVSPAAFAGCQPLDVLGEGNSSQAAIDYITGNTSWSAKNTMHDLGGNLSGTLLDGWAGPVKFAAGLEYRHQRLNETTSVEDNGFDATGLRVGLNGTTPAVGTQLWTKNVAAATRGVQSVYEGNLELNVPILRDLPLVRTASISAAGRFTHYSTSGSVGTWRVGLDWQPLPGLNLRATRSRDIRAPTLYELYQGQTATISGYTDYLTGANGQILNISKGNPDLKPEVARNITVGGSYQPPAIPGLSLSFDYYDIRIRDAIAALSGLTTSVEKICIASGGSSPLCDLVARPGPITDTSLANTPTANYKQNENVAQVHSSGFVVGLDYGFDLAGLTRALDGKAGLAVRWTHEPVLKTQSLPGAVITNAAGTALAPADRITAVASYGVGGTHAAVTVRYFSSFRYSADPTLVVADPASKAYVQTDFNLSQDFSVRDVPVTLFANVNNVFNVHGGLYEPSSSNPGLIYPAAPFVDQIGRYFTVGLRFDGL